MSKIFTSIINTRLKIWCETNNVLGEEQAGFRKQHTTIDHVFCLHTLMTKYLRHEDGRFYALFVDFEKAFDHVDRLLLWQKLFTQNVSIKMVRMLKAIYADVRAYIRTSKGLTNTVPCPVGVRQDCIISPIIGGGRVVRWCWVNFQYRGVLQFGYSRARAYCTRSR